MVDVPGLAWAWAWANQVQQSYQGQPFTSISRADLITAKLAARCPLDLEVVRALEAISD